MMLERLIVALREMTEVFLKIMVKIHQMFLMYQALSFIYLLTP